MTNTSHDTSTGEVPFGWELCRLDEIAEVQLGRSRSPKNAEGPDMRPYLRAANVTWQGLDLAELKEMNFSDNEMDRYRLEAGDILVNEASGSASEVGKTVLFSGEVDNCAFQNHLIRVRTPPQVRDYVFWFLAHNAYVGAYISESQGVGINHLGKAKLAGWPTPIPPLGEQERIVEVLEAQWSRLDAALGHVQTVRDKAAQLRRSLLHAAFTGALTGHDTSTGQLPDGWAGIALGERVAFQNGYAFKSSWFVPDGVSLVRGMNIGHGKLDWSDRRAISPERAKEFERFCLTSGDLLVALDRPLISTGLKWAEVVENDLPALLLQRVARFFPEQSAFSKGFLRFWIQSPFFIDGINPGRSVAVPHISTKELGALPVQLPPLAEQDRIVELLEAQLSRLDAALVVADEVEERALALRRSLLHAAFTGKLTEKWREENDV